MHYIFKSSVAPSRLIEMQERGGKLWTLRRNHFYPVESDGTTFKLNGIPVEVVRQMTFTTLYRAKKELIPLEYVRGEPVRKRPVTLMSRRTKKKTKEMPPPPPEKETRASGKKRSRVRNYGGEVTEEEEEGEDTEEETTPERFGSATGGTANFGDLLHRVVL